jgi:Rieske Fe-S protein
VRVARFESGTQENALIARRTFLKLVSGCVSVAGCSADGGDVQPIDVGNVAAGNASSVSVGSLTVIAAAPACVCRDQNGVYAMTLICTHQGCDMSQRGSVTAQGIVCACHGSEFDVNGNVVRGPASSGLAHFLVSADSSGSLTIHTGTEVDASTRLAVA